MMVVESNLGQNSDKVVMDNLNSYINVDFYSEPLGESNPFYQVYLGFELLSQS